MKKQILISNFLPVQLKRRYHLALGRMEYEQTIFPSGFGGGATALHLADLNGADTSGVEEQIRALEADTAAGKELMAEAKRDNNRYLSEALAARKAAKDEIAAKSKLGLPTETLNVLALAKFQQDKRNQHLLSESLALDSKGLLAICL